MQKDVKTQKITNYTSSLTLNNFCYEIKISHKLPVIMISFSKTSNPSFCWQQTVVFFFRTNQTQLALTNVFTQATFFSCLLRYSWGITYFWGWTITIDYQKYRYRYPFIIISFDALPLLIEIINNASHGSFFFGPDLTNGKMTLHINALCVRGHGTKTVDASFNASAKIGDTETQAFFREGSSQGFGTHFFKYSEDFTYSLDSQSDWKPPE